MSAQDARGPEDHDHERRGVAQSQRLTPGQLQVRNGGADEELRAGFAADAEALLERLHARARRLGELAPGRGTVELLQVLSARLSLGGGFWTWIDNLNFGSLGYLIVALFVLMWTASFAIWKLRRIEDRWGGG